MLGNEFESMFMPSAIVIVEGESDVTFLTRYFGIHLPDRRVAVIRAGGEGEIRSKLHTLRETFGDLSSSPYQNRLFVVLDSKNSLKRTRLEGMGVLRENIKVSAKNGIEYQYPIDLVAAAFRCDQADIQKIDLECDPIEFNGIRKSKKDLAQHVADGLSVAHRIGDEAAALLQKVTAACG